ncbi:hypothetical protein FHW96_004698 [Novosphingobium sp. SG751A]|uniref:SIR2 family protein n=1 Tax=Novosphingobium sp. SG751A TaxID=2587000 RepID=UPI0015538070|nr:SIR2 family protein [Novosphingobium sp. SG751A]NOW48510.1 hypothetical protein [Novosphingobium sp. SG751A]
MTTILTENRDEVLAELGELLAGRRIVPYLGPGLSAYAPVPMTPEDLATFFAAKTTLPRRAVGNAWAAAQYIESHRFRDTLTAWMREAFAPRVAPAPWHRWLAAQGLPLIVDSWYAGEMREALIEAGGNWAEVQGISRALIGEDKWFRFFDAAGAPIRPEQGAIAQTLLYAPHGSARPAVNFLISDADYVEVLTEIDIQTPIPEEVRRRRTGQSFLFIGCRFHDQMLRSYARQIIKRSSDRHFAIVDLAGLTRNEQRFLDEHDFAVIDLPVDEAFAALTA